MTDTLLTTESPTILVPKEERHNGRDSSEQSDVMCAIP